MSEVLLKHEKEALCGVLRFDGEVFEAFGFEVGGSFDTLMRVPVAMMQGAEVSFDKGLLKTPQIRITGREDLPVGFALIAIDPDPSEQAAIVALVEEVQSAIARRAKT